MADMNPLLTGFGDVVCWRLRHCRLQLVAVDGLKVVCSVIMSDCWRLDGAAESLGMLDEDGVAGRCHEMRAVIGDKAVDPKAACSMLVSGGWRLDGAVESLGILDEDGVAGRCHKMRQ